MQGKPYTFSRHCHNQNIGDNICGHLNTICLCNTEVSIILLYGHSLRDRHKNQDKALYYCL